MVVLLCRWFALNWSCGAIQAGPGHSCSICRASMWALRLRFPMRRPGDDVGVYSIHIHIRDNCLLSTNSRLLWKYRGTYTHDVMSQRISFARGAFFFFLFFLGGNIDGLTFFILLGGTRALRWIDWLFFGRKIFLHLTL